MSGFQGQKVSVLVESVCASEYMSVLAILEWGVEVCKRAGKSERKSSGCLEQFHV